MKFYLLLVFSIATLLCSYGCQPTPYQRKGPSSALGYSDKKLSDNTFQVWFFANSNTPPNTVREYLYKRAAEITIKNGGVEQSNFDDYEIPKELNN